MKLHKYISQNKYGFLLFIFGIIVVTIAILFSPTFVEKYLLSDHNITQGGIKKLSCYRLSLSLGGLLLFVIAIILPKKENLRIYIQRILTTLHFKDLFKERSKGTTLTFFLLLIGLFGIAGFVMILLFTPYGAGVSHDSIIYVGGAKSLLSGDGYSINGSPINHFPPLYSLFLATTGLFENNLVQAARFLNAFLFGVNIGLFASAIYLTAGRNFLTTTIAMFFFLSSAPILYLHSMAWSEPLFITFSLSCIILLYLYANHPTLSFFIASSLSLGFAVITRYIGIGFLPAAMIIVFIGQGGQKFMRKLRVTMIWLVVSCFPLIIFLLINFLRSGSPTSRHFAFHPLSISHYLTAVIQIALDLIAPISLPFGVRLAIFGLLAIYIIAFLIILFKRNIREINWRSMDFLMPISCLIFSISYLVFLFISISTMDAATPVDTRLLSPILIIMTVGGFSAVWAGARTDLKPPLKLYFLLFIVLSVFSKIPDAIRTTGNIHADGLWYTSRQWLNSETIAFFNKIADDEKVYYSNGPYVINFLTGRQSLSIPRIVDPYSMEKNPVFIEEIGIMCNDIIENKGLLVYFDKINKTFIPTQEEVISTCKLPILKHLADGTIYGEN